LPSVKRRRGGGFHTGRRFAGIRGSVEMAGQGNLDAKTTGVLGDSFASFSGTYTLQK
jgi:hypothetical protein